MIKKELVHRLIDQLFEVGEKIQDKVIPCEANQHFKKARKEGLLGIQAMLSHLIEEIDKDPQKKPNRDQQVKNINIEE